MDAVAGARLSSRVARGDGRALGLGLFMGTTAACAVALALHVSTGNYAALGYVAVPQAVALMGLVLTTKMPRNRVSWVLAFAPLWWAVGAVANAYAIEALVDDPGTLPWGLAAAWLDNWFWLPGLTLFVCALLVLTPDGRLPSPRWWPAPALVLAGTVLGSIAVSFAPTFDLRGESVGNPWSASRVVAAAAGVTGSVLVVGGLAASLAALIVRYRRADGDARQQLRWIVVAFAVAAALVVFGAPLWGTVPGAAALPALALLLPPAAIAAAILKYRLYELDLVVNRMAVYLLLTAAVVLAYVLAVGVVGATLAPGGDVVASLVVTGIVAVCFQPLRGRLQRIVNRVMYGDRGDPYAALAGLGRMLASAGEHDTILPTTVETIARTLALRYAALSVSGDASGPAREVAAYGAPADHLVSVPLVHQGVSVGELRLAPRAGERLRERDHRLISDIAPQVAAAVHGVALSQELQDARRRLVALREEERRRIRRDLHDGLGPSLAGLTLTLEAARNLSGSDPEGADRLLASATAELQTTIADVRRLIYGLRPPTLDQLGLVAAVRELARRHDTGATRVEVAASDAMPPLEAAIEVAAYLIAQEALTNVSRHASARRCTVSLALEDSTLKLDVADDGRGITGRPVGVGVQAMAERAAELGGTCEMTGRHGGGTLVSARLPVEARGG